jgi:hypothetical protein
MCRGLVLAYEAHREETVGHIDYLADADRLYRGVANVKCLEIGKTDMRFLERCIENHSEASQLKSFHRVGVSWKFRADFFEGKARMRIQLI